MDIQAVEMFLRDLQSRICSTLEQVDTEAAFIEEAWERPEGGGGATRVLSEGAVFEKAGVNFSHVMGDNLPGSATAARPQLAGTKFSGDGCFFGDSSQQSLCAHVTCKYSTLCRRKKPGEDPVWWMGGGFDLNALLRLC